ncbi:MAG: hypothetical protein Q8K18_01340 [Burkholderiales bacterium]|nr:hypothetical protein [Burkholderiales bacterium]
MIKDLWNTIRLYIEDRLSSPLLTGFIFAWSIINYRFFLILFSNERFIEKIDLIEKYVFPSNEIKLYKGFLYPLAAALVYVLIYPFIDRLIFKAWRWHQHKLIKTRQLIDEERPLSEKDRTQLLSRLYDAERKQEVETQRSETTIEVQRARIKEHEATIEVQRVRIKEFEEQTLAIEKNKTPPNNLVTPVMQEENRKEQSLLEQPLTIEALSSYVKYRFPNKPVGEDILELLLRDINKQRYPKIRNLNDVVERASSAVEKYKDEKPELFKKGADYITKSLGFVDNEFRLKHQFSKETLQAIAKINQSSRKILPDTDHTDIENVSSIALEILEYVANAERDDQSAYENSIYEKVNGDKVEIKYTLDDLENKKLLKSYSDQDEGKFYDLTHDGRRVLLALGKAGSKRNLE